MKTTEEKKEYFKTYYQNNKIIMDQRHKEYVTENKDNLLKYYAKRQLGLSKSDEMKLIKLITKSISAGYGTRSRVNEVLGISYSGYREYLESKFESWMNWSNKGDNRCFGLNQTWDIDHIIPLSKAKTMDELIELLHYTNTQPLCSYTNRYVKRNRI